MIKGVAVGAIGMTLLLSGGAKAQAESAPAPAEPAPGVPSPDQETPVGPAGPLEGTAPPSSGATAPTPPPTVESDTPPAPSGPPPVDRYTTPGAVTPEATTTSSARPPTDRQPPTREPPAPEPVRHAAPKTAFWTGVRGGWFVPFGTLWHDGFVVSGLCCAYDQRSFSDYASSGPVFEIDAGARLSRRYTLFGLWEHASLGPGSLDPDAFGGQQRGATNLFAAGLRFSTNPDDIGFLLELAIGYREFTGYWEDGTELRLRDGMFDARIGIGADLRLTPFFSLSPMLTLSSGAFGDAYWAGPRESGPAVNRFDTRGQYGSVTLQLGAHFDVY